MRHEKIKQSIKEEREEMNQRAQLSKLRADMDYIGMMAGVEIEEEETEAMNHEQEV